VRASAVVAYYSEVADGARGGMEGRVSMVVMCNLLRAALVWISHVEHSFEYCVLFDRSAVLLPAQPGRWERGHRPDGVRVAAA